MYKTFVEESEGWMSWAWNSVVGEYEDDPNPSLEPNDDPDSKSEESKNSAVPVAIGVYFKNVVLMLKSGRRPSRNLFGLYLDGTAIEMGIRGDAFFS